MLFSIGKMLLRLRDLHQILLFRKLWEKTGEHGEWNYSTQCIDWESLISIIDRPAVSSAQLSINTLPTGVTTHHGSNVFLSNGKKLRQLSSLGAVRTQRTVLSTLSRWRMLRTVGLNFNSILALSGYCQFAILSRSSLYLFCKPLQSALSVLVFPKKRDNKGQRFEIKL